MGTLDRSRRAVAEVPSVDNYAAAPPSLAELPAGDSEDW